MIHQSILQAIGATPIVRLPALSSELNVNVFAKLESLNPGGSHKVRIAYAMVQNAEMQGVLTRGSGQTVIEPSGGNTGIGLAMVCNNLGYNLMLVIPDNYSIQKQQLLRLYGATVVQSDSSRGNNSHGEKAMELQLRNPEYVMLNQQRNAANPEIHRNTTAQEIVSDFCDADIDCFVSGIGTGGHITGIGEVLRQHWPHLKIIGVEPSQCSLKNDIHAPHKIQGLSIGLVPPILNLDIVDEMVGVNYEDCVQMAATILKTDSISVGLSSAANLVAVKRIAAYLSTGSNILTMVYDGIESYVPEITQLGAELYEHPCTA